MVLLSALQRVISKYTVEEPTSVPPDNQRATYGRIELQKSAFLFDIVDNPELISVVESEIPLSMESVGQVDYSEVTFCLKYFCYWFFHLVKWWMIYCLFAI